MFLTVIIFVAILVILILIHELGHFIVAKLCGVKVEEFAFGFPPRLFSLNFHGTRYSFNLIPLGGYVSLLGEFPECLAENFHHCYRGADEFLVSDYCFNHRFSNRHGAFGFRSS